jgi:hypothetical protein
MIGGQDRVWARQEMGKATSIAWDTSHLLGRRSSTLQLGLPALSAGERHVTGGD